MRSEIPTCLSSPCNRDPSLAGVAVPSSSVSTLASGGAVREKCILLSWLRYLRLRSKPSFSTILKVLRSMAPEPSARRSFKIESRGELGETELRLCFGPTCPGLWYPGEQVNVVLFFSLADFSIFDSAGSSANPSSCCMCKLSTSRLTLLPSINFLTFVTLSSLPFIVEESGCKVTLPTVPFVATVSPPLLILRGVLVLDKESAVLQASLLLPHCWCFAAPPRLLCFLPALQFLCQYSSEALG
mmetsp:Transcript_17209/g.30272  ORF Transcript_17209/g.30272 Transcript_17209/m.30272 type:complete len:243 (-) Transcript_17209:325-1053(-)